MFCYIFIDGNYIIPTAFDFLVIFLNITFQSHIMASKKLLKDYINEVIEPHISHVQLEIAKEGNPNN